MKNSFFLSMAALLCPVLVYSAPAPAEMEPDDNTVAFWDLSIQKKNVIQDQSGFGNDLSFRSLEKAPLPVIKKDEGAIFDAQGGLLEVKPKESLRIRKGDFSIEFVFKCGEKLDTKKQAFYLGGNKSYSEASSGFNIDYSVWNGIFFNFNYTMNKKRAILKGRCKAPLEKNKWHHLLISRKGDKLAIWLNGVKLAEKVEKGNIDLAQKFPLRIGIYPTPWQRTKDKKLKTIGFIGTIRYIRFSDIGRGK